MSTPLEDVVKETNSDIIELFKDHFGSFFNELFDRKLEEIKLEIKSVADAQEANFKILDDDLKTLKSTMTELDAKVSDIDIRMTTFETVFRSSLTLQAPVSNKFAEIDRVQSGTGFRTANSVYKIRI